MQAAFARRSARLELQRRDRRRFSMLAADRPISQPSSPERPIWDCCIEGKRSNRLTAAIPLRLLETRQSANGAKKSTGVGSAVDVLCSVSGQGRLADLTTALSRAV